MFLTWVLGPGNSERSDDCYHVHVPINLFAGRGAGSSSSKFYFLVSKLKYYAIKLSGMKTCKYSLTDTLKMCITQTSNPKIPFIGYSIL